MRTRTLWALAGGLLAGCGGEVDPPIAAVGSPAPPFATETLAGDSVSLEGLRGKVVLLNIWATWCDPCREEIPELQEIHEAYSGRGLEVVGVSVDGPAQARAIREFARDFGMTYALWYDQEGTSQRVFRTLGIPNTFLFDRSGVMKWKVIGPLVPSDSSFARALEDALAAVDQ